MKKLEIEHISGRRETLLAKLHELEDSRFEIRIDDPAHPEFWLSIRLALRELLDSSHEENE